MEFQVGEEPVNFLMRLLKQDMEDTLADQNDINESTRAQLDAISEALAELQPREPKLGKRGLLLIVSFKIIKYQI